LFPTIITKEHEISYLDEIDSFSLRYKNIVQEHKASGMSIIKRWKLLKEDYPNLFQVAKALLIIPYSTSTVESLFSEFRAFKTNYRNRLNVANLEASVLAEQYFRKENPRILPAMIDKYFTLWKKEEKKEDYIEIKETDTQIGNFSKEVPRIDEVNFSLNRESNNVDFAKNLPSLMGTMTSLYCQSVNKQEEHNLNSLMATLLMKPLKEKPSSKRKPEDPMVREDQKKMKTNQEENANTTNRDEPEKICYKKPRKENN